MRALLQCGFVLFLAGGLSAQYRGNPTPVVTGGFGNILYPGGTSATMPGIQRTTPNIVFPGGGGPHFYTPFAPGSSRPQHRNTGTVLIPYAVPIYVGGYADSSYYESAPSAAPQQPNITVIYPPQPAPVIINQFGPAATQPQADSSQAPPSNLYVSPPDDAASAPPAEPAPYLLAFKDHTVYSAVAYWVDGDTLHYFTSGNTHNQVSIALVDRELTERLNRESGREVRLPVAK